MSAYGSRPAATSGSRTNGLAIAGLVCGIVGLFFLSIILGPLAIIFGSVGLRQKAGGGGMAKAGIILGVIDVILFIVVMIVAASNGFSWYIGG
ncbi:DUF4190 domain-containing protein [Streptomyces sp. SID14478]|uniref:DUF4190 domain-containing protein n=1 Tax=Streptomyces sp. SID14478 TaxID=2706073 RepID=UPI0013D93299|nr:DUF4190 domain-containing protein [Streptomyces sp. SID14478]NEB78843.1 DUF4190 domain-containing protein [Streptomyces sp. SID14478]